MRQLTVATSRMEDRHWENSEALMEYLPIVPVGPDAWVGSDTVRCAIEIRDGRVRNLRILSFQAATRPMSTRSSDQ